MTFKEGEYVEVKDGYGHTVRGEICQRVPESFRIRYFDVSTKRPADIWRSAEDIKPCNEKVDWVNG